MADEAVGFLANQIGVPASEIGLYELGGGRQAKRHRMEIRAEDAGRPTPVPRADRGRARSDDSPAAVPGPVRGRAWQLVCTSWEVNDLNTTRKPLENRRFTPDGLINGSSGDRVGVLFAGAFRRRTARPPGESTLSQGTG